MKRRNEHLLKNVNPSGLKAKELKDLCKRMNIKATSALRKSDMVILVDVFLRETNVPFEDNMTMRTFYPPVYVNDNDPISQESLEHWRASHVFTMAASSNFGIPQKVYRFDPTNLVKMILTTGKSINPFSQDEMSEEDLSRLEYAYFNCLRCSKNSPSDRSSFLAMRPDVRPRMIGDIYPLYEGMDEDSFCNDFLPWITRNNLIVARNTARRMARHRIEIEQTTEYLVYMFEKDLAALVKMISLFPVAARAPVQVNFSESIVNYFVPAIFDHLHALFVWNSEEGIKAVARLTDHADNARVRDEHSFESTVFSYASTVCLEGVLSFYVSYYDEHCSLERKAQILKELSTKILTYSSRSLIQSSLNQRSRPLSL